MRRTPAAATLAAAALAAIAAHAGAAPPPFSPPVFVLNTTAPCFQHSPDLAPLGGGGFVATWSGELATGGTGIGGRLLDADGVPLGDELALVETTPTDARQPRVAPAADGSFVVAWYELHGEFGLRALVYLQRFDADGAPQGAPVLVTDTLGFSPLWLDLATDGLGRPAVAWSQSAGVLLRLYEADLTARSDERVVTLLPTDLPPVLGDLSIAATPAGELLVVWEEGPNQLMPPPSPSQEYDRVLGRRFDADGVARGPAFTIDSVAPGNLGSQAPSAAALAGGGWAVAWARNRPVTTISGVYARLLDPAGTPAGPEFRASSLVADAFDPDLEPLPDGGFALTWSSRRLPPFEPPPGFDNPLVWLQRFDAAGVPFYEDDGLIDFPTDRHQSTPAAAFRRDGTLVIVWHDYKPVPLGLPPPCAGQSTINARALDLGCVAGPERLCLLGGRFAVELLVDDPRLAAPSPRPARAAPLTGDTGTFWFFRPENTEVTVKVLDGSEVNGWFWFFSGALTDIGYEVVVTDTLFGIEKRYRNLPGEVASRADTRALPDLVPLPGVAGSSRAGGTVPDALLLGPPAGTAGPVAADVAAALDGTDGAEGLGGGGPRPLAGATHPLPPCDAPGVLCLRGERFGVSIEWRDPRSGVSGVATGVPLTDESAYFWFFRPGNVEIVLKVLDGSFVNNHFWVFFGGLTDLEYTIEVEDRVKHEFWTYQNPPFALTSHADTRALPGDFPPCPVCALAPALTRSAQGDGTP